MLQNESLCDRTTLERSSTSTDSLRTLKKEKKTRKSIKFIDSHRVLGLIDFHGLLICSGTSVSCLNPLGLFSLLRPFI